MDEDDFYDRKTLVMPETYNHSINEDWDEITPLYISNLTETTPLTKKIVDIHTEETNLQLEDIDFACDITNIEIDSDHIFDIIWSQPDKKIDVYTGKPKNQMSLKEKLYAYLWEGRDIKDLI